MPAVGRTEPTGGRGLTAGWSQVLDRTAALEHSSDDSGAGRDERFPMNGVVPGLLRLSDSALDPLDLRLERSPAVQARKGSER